MTAHLVGGLTNVGCELIQGLRGTQGHCRSNVCSTAMGRGAMAANVSALAAATPRQQACTLNKPTAPEQE